LKQCNLENLKAELDEKALSALQLAKVWEKIYIIHGVQHNLHLAVQLLKLYSEKNDFS